MTVSILSTAAATAVLHPQLRGNGAVAAAKREVLRYLARCGPSAVRELPHRWPITRQHLPVLIDQLRAHGLVELSRPSAPAQP